LGQREEGSLASTQFQTERVSNRGGRKKTEETRGNQKKWGQRFVKNWPSVQVGGRGHGHGLNHPGQHKIIVLQIPSLMWIKNRRTGGSG